MDLPPDLLPPTVLPMPPRPQPVTYGSLECLRVDGGPAPRIAVVLCHGYGAPGHDLAGLALEWIEMLREQAEAFRFVFPAAPHRLTELGMPEGRAWWPINMARLAEIVQTQRLGELQTQQPPGIDDARERLTESVEAILDELGGTAPLVLGGFSQGAMLSMDVALRGKIPPPDCLFQFSGTLICRQAWSEALDRLVGTPVFQSHGRYDPILPFAGAKALRELLVDRGVEVDFHPFDGPHTIDLEAVARTAGQLQRMA